MWYLRTSETHLAAPCVPLFCSYHILTSSVVYYWTFLECNWVIYCYQLSWKRQLTTVKSLKADVSSVSLITLRWPIYVFNSVDNTKLPCYTLPPQRNTTVSLETYRLYSFLECLLNNLKRRKKIARKILCGHRKPQLVQRREIQNSAIYLVLEWINQRPITNAASWLARLLVLFILWDVVVMVTSSMRLSSNKS